ncbi:transcriptional regulator [Streptomyces sp. 150FB]|uniref:helix-turn-helix transcriptional regulator n=1 Tax=Streptomyces sp. 150FB TaxID=1576605 RepID=UPI000588FCFE|nr:WYL domain-containing protein [Streptomyces sp. 150FB]KIF79052.1 transcriptional regulator [Streptomyces sp. 150FB]
MRASRLLSLLLLLQARGRLTAQQLADELDVSIRTVYRDVESLSAAGVPLYGEAGHEGGYRLVDGYRTRLTGLTSEEAEALFLSGLPGPAADLGLGGVLATVQLKLTAALPEELRDRAGRIQQRFHLDTSNWYDAAGPTPHLAGVVRAVWDQRRIRMRYRRWAEPREVDRTLDPYGVVLKSGRWYLLAGGTETAARQGTPGSAARTYRVSQILDLEVLDEPAARPEGFDLAEQWGSYLAEFDRRRVQGEAVLLVTPELLARLPHLLEPSLARAARAGAGPPGSDGRIRVAIPLESTAHTASLVLRLGAEAEVVSPPGLRRAVGDAVRTLADTYARRPPELP